MARILYAVQGDGLGHATRAHSVGRGLIKRGHEVHFVSSLKGTSYLKQVFNGTVTDIYGFKLSYDDGRVRRLRTACGIVGGIAFHARRALQRVREVFHRIEPQLLVTDAEAFCPLIARSEGVPFVSLDNQHLLTHCDIDRPHGKLGDYLSAYATVHCYYAGARRYLVSTFHNARIRYQPTTLVPPIIRERVYATQSTIGNYLLAYLGGSGDHGPMRRALEAYHGMPIKAYGFDITEVRASVTYKPRCADEFLNDLAGCAGVIASAGHSLISECLHLQKPMLLLPFSRQFEQLLNVHHVEQMGVGCGASALTTDIIASFVERLSMFRQTLALRTRPSLDPVLDAIERELP